MPTGDWRLNGAFEVVLIVGLSARKQLAPLQRDSRLEQKRYVRLEASDQGTSTSGARGGVRSSPKVAKTHNPSEERQWNQAERWMKSIRYKYTRRIALRHFFPPYPVNSPQHGYLATSAVKKK
jgi:hypothetical protein